MVIRQEKFGGLFLLSITIMKNFILILALTVLSFSAHSQDMVGSKMSDIRTLVRHVSGITVKSIGDSVMVVFNKQLKRTFTFKFDRTTHICFQEDIRLNFSAFRNITIMNQLARSGRSTSVDITEAESVYETPDKMIFIRPEGEQVNIIFSLKKTNPSLDGSAFNKIKNIELQMASIK